MSPELDEMLVNEVVPRLRAAASSIPRVGCEDAEEILQDLTVMAAKLMDSAERSGRSFTAGNISYYAERAARSGRRSYYAGRSDVMSPGCQLDGKAQHEWLDSEFELESGESGTLHDIIAPNGYQGQEADVADEAARNLDWKAFLESHSLRHRTALVALLGGESMREAGVRCGLRDSAALLLRRRIAADLIEFFGEDVVRRLLDGNRPGWEFDLQTVRERHSCHVESARDSARTGHR